MKHLVCNLLLLLSLKAATAQSYTITGKLDGTKSDSVYLFITKDRTAPRDTFRTRAVNGVFTFTGKVNGVYNATLIPGGIKSGKFFSFFAEPGKIQLAGHVDTMDYIRAYGTYNNNLQTQSRMKEAVQYATIKTLREQKKLDEAEKLYDEIWADKRDFIRQYPASRMSVMNMWVLFDRVPLDTAKALFALLPPASKQSDFGTLIQQRIVAKERVRVGNTAPLFDAVDVNGNKVSLASLKGKYVLLDFWASWCVPCRAENPYVVAAYEKYKDKGFTVISVSLDHDRAKWIEAIKKDNLDWTHISELKRFEEPIANLYAVQPIPDNFLIGPDGKIKAAQLRGEALQQTLAQLIK